MTTDEKVELAQKIAKKLVGIAPSEWSKWCSYAQKKGLKKAMQLAQVMQRSISLRKGPQQTYQTIAQVIGEFQRKLESLPADELGEVLGYVHRELYAQALMSQRSGDTPRRIDNRRRR